MFDNWLSPLKSPNNAGYSAEQLGNSIESWNINSKILNRPDILILYSNEIQIDRFRKSLFEKFSHFNVRIVELGQVLKTDGSFLLPLIKELLQTNRIVYLGPREGFDDILRLNKEHDLGLDKQLIVENAIKDSNSDLNHLAFQRHLTAPSKLSVSDDFKKCGLGDLKSNISKAEPIIRDRAYIQFNLNALEKQASLLETAPITGLSIYQACQISKYCGHSGKLKIFHLGIPKESDENWANIASIMIWYLFEGMDNCIYENASDSANQSYLVNSNFMEKPIKFIKGSISGRWWLVNPNSEKPEYIPCDLDDYSKVSQGIIPDKFLSLEA